MATPTRMLLTISFLLCSLGLWAQDKVQDQGNEQEKAQEHQRLQEQVQAQEKAQAVDADLLARLSYQSSSVVTGSGVGHVCIAVTRDGEYRIVRTVEYGQTQRLRGKMPKEQLDQLTKLLGTAEFRALSGDHSGLIRQDAEVFGAEIPRQGRVWVGAPQWMDRDVWRLQWLNADGESPFPGSVAKVVDWLRHFEPKDGKSFVYAEFPDVCPNRGLRLVQPAVAENQHP